jgi:hypothetical protein
MTDTIATQMPAQVPEFRQALVLPLVRPHTHSRGDLMFADIAPYLMALSAMTFAALSAVTLISWVDRFDPPAADTPAEPRKQAAAA